MSFLNKKFRTMSIQFNYNYPQLAREAGFRLRQYKDGPLDWRLLGNCEIERLLRDQSIEDVDKVLVHLSEAPLGTVLLDTNILDPAIAKYFIVSQFAIQFLLFCRNFLDETVQDLRESHAEAQVELARLKKLLAEANNEILQLHKKMTQMEAIHEVIYPCHLCTKNFANNEALNIHIGRKHNNSKKPTERQRTETPVSAQKERNTDLTLINTIKLELEIKQLKERLNNAEKEIKERRDGRVEWRNDNIEPVPTTSTTETRNVAIQSNLSEEKEKNDSNEDEHELSNTLEERKAQLENLQLKIFEIEEWRATQMNNNEDSIAEINKKLTDIAQALERTTETKKSPNKTNEDNDDTHERALERRLSVEDLERVLSEKVAEIGKASTEKLEEIVQNMESNYRSKLIELECEVKKAQQEAKIRDVQVNQIQIQNLSKQKEEIITTSTPIQTKIRKVRKAAEDIESDDEENGTYNIEKNIEKEVAAIKVKESISQPTGSSQTFVKKLETAGKTVVIQTVAAVEENFSDDTNISESLSDDAKSPSDEESEKRVKPLTIERKKRVDEVRKTDEFLKAKSPRKYTRKDAKNLAGKRLSKYGCDMRMRSLSSSTYKRLNLELNEKRNKLKQQYPNFYATRNRIKKFVDKLCTTKSTDKAEKMLTTTATLQPMKVPKHMGKKLSSTHNDEDVPTSDLDEDYVEDNNKETKTNTVTSDDFKKRLERLLSSPMQRPGGTGNPTTTVAQVHGETMPMPVPRKRVMFNTAISKNAASGNINEF